MEVWRGVGVGKGFEGKVDALVMRGGSEACDLSGAKVEVAENFEEILEKS
jgi:hypothetical protein